MSVLPSGEVGSENSAVKRRAALFERRLAAATSRVEESFSRVLLHARVGSTPAEAEVNALVVQSEVELLAQGAEDLLCLIQDIRRTLVLFDPTLSLEEIRREGEKEEESKSVSQEQQN